MTIVDHVDDGVRDTYIVLWCVVSMRRRHRRPPFLRALRAPPALPRSSGLVDCGDRTLNVAAYGVWWAGGAGDKILYRRAWAYRRASVHGMACCTMSHQSSIFQRNILEKKPSACPHRAPIPRDTAASFPLQHARALGDVDTMVPRQTFIPYTYLPTTGYCRASFCKAFMK